MALFNQHQVETPESVALEFTLAGIGNRLYALVIDYLCLGVIIILMLLAWGVFAYNLNAYGAQVGWQQWLFAVQTFLMFAVFVGYFVFFETVWQGQTPGKRLAHIRVIREDGRPIGLSQALLRALFRPLDDWLYIGALLIIFNRQEKRMGDWLAGTLVIQESRDPKGDRLKLGAPNQARMLAKCLSPDHLAALSTEQWLVIREFLAGRTQLLPEARKNTADRLTDQLKQYIDFPQQFQGMTPELVIEAVFYANNHPQFPTVMKELGAEGKESGSTKE